MKKLVKLLKAYEIRTAPKLHPNSKVIRYPHWYRLNIYSDGAGTVIDSLTNEVKFRFKDVEELNKNLVLVV